MKENTLNLNYDYMDLVIQFGKISLFAPCFPLAGAIVLINNNFLVISGIHNINIFKRTIPDVSIGIGPFIWMIEILSYISVVVNMAILIWTSDRVESFFVTDYKVLTTV